MKSIGDIRMEIERLNREKHAAIARGDSARRDDGPAGRSPAAAREYAAAADCSAKIAALRWVLA